VLELENTLFSKKNACKKRPIEVRSSFLIQVSCMVYTIKKLEFKKLEWRLGCKTCIVYTGLKGIKMFIITTTRVVQRWREKRKLQHAGKRQLHGLMK
jgi:hypothetical protein